MDYIYTTATVSVITVGTICFNYYAPKIDYQFVGAAAMDLLKRCKKKLVGISSFHKARNNYFVKTDLGPMAVNHHKTPALDTDVYFFNKGHMLEVNENKMLKKSVFEETFKGEDTTLLKKYNFGIIGDTYYPRDFRNKDKLVGFIFNPLENYVYVFVIEQNQIIDYKTLFVQYEEVLYSTINATDNDSDNNDGSGVDELVRISSQSLDTQEPRDSNALDALD